MSQLLEHRGFLGTVLYSAEDKLLHGRLVGVRGLVSYEGASVAGLETDFRAAVDEYIADAPALNMATPPVGQTVPVPLAPELHERAVRFAEQHDTDLSELVGQAVSKYLDQAA